MDRSKRKWTSYISIDAIPADFKHAGHAANFPGFRSAGNIFLPTLGLWLRNAISMDINATLF